jgi:hypothetical protein
VPSSNATACDTNSYAIIVTVVETVSIRKLFVNCMKWLLDRNVQEIWIILPLSKERLANETVYGGRLLVWDQLPDHPVRILSSALLEAVADIDRLSSQNALVWMNGDRPYKDHSSIQTGLGQWKEQVAAIHGMTGRFVAEPPSASSWQEPFGKLLVADNNTLSQATVVVLPDLLHGLVHHRDYLWFLSSTYTHPTLLSDNSRSIVIKDVVTFRLWAVLWLSYLSALPLRFYSTETTAKREAVDSRLTADDYNNNDTTSLLQPVLDFFGGLEVWPDDPHSRPMQSCTLTNNNKTLQ